jgi:hypothetical protein
MTTIAEIVDEWFQNEPTPERQQNMRRMELIAELEQHSERCALAKLRAEFVEAHLNGASSNDIVQLLDDHLTGRGLPTVLYA